MPQQQKLDQRPCIAPLQHLHTDIHMKGRTGRQAGKVASKLADRQAGRQTNRQTDRQAGRPADRPAGGQRDRHFCSPFQCSGVSGLLHM